MNELRTLVISKEFLPLYFLPAKQALLLELTGRAETIVYYQNSFIRSVTRCFKLPAVIKVSLSYKRFFARRPSKVAIFYRDNFTCAYCGRHLTLSECTIDHIQPKSKGGNWSWENLVAACRQCNSKKANDRIEPKFVKPYRPAIFDLQLKQLQDTLPIEIKEFLQQMGFFKAV